MSEERELLKTLVERWIIELENNKAELDLTMPKELHPMMLEKIDEALDLAHRTKAWI